MNKYRCPLKGEPVRLTSTSGHICIVDHEFSEVPPHMEPDAAAAGCISEEVYNELRDQIANELKASELLKMNAGLTPEQRMEKIKASMNEMLNSSNTTYFTAKGLPNKKELNSRCGFTVEDAEFIAAWEKVAGQAQATPPSDLNGAS